MTAARYLIGDVRTVLATLPDNSVDAVITSPPYWQLRSYLPATDPAKTLEIGQEPTPGAYLEGLLSMMDDLWPKMTATGTYWINLGDSHAGSGGSGGDYDEGGMREHQARWMGTRRSAREASAKMPWRGSRPGMPRDQSVCWIPHLFGAGLAYGRNLLTGVEHRQWVTRPPVTWCKPNPSVGQLTRKFRTATELWVYGGKTQDHYFDLDSVREEPKPDPRLTNGKPVTSGAYRGHPDERRATSRPDRVCNELGVPPKNWWVVPSQPYPGAHYAVFPPELVRRPVICGCPPGGVILDPFAGSGTTLQVATGYGRDAIGIDLDPRNADLALDRVGPLLLTVKDMRPATTTEAAS